MATLTNRTRRRTHLALFSGAIISALVLLIAIFAASLDMDGSLNPMGASQRQTNVKLDQMRVLSSDMKALEIDLRGMRGDIHVMSHKIDGSFLFRAVK